MLVDLTDEERRRLRGVAQLDDGTVALVEDDLLLAWSTALAARGRPGSPETLAVYVNVPYCQSRCRYCMYPSFRLQHPEQIGAFVDYVVVRLARLRGRVGRLRASSIYVGGGTPSLLPPAELDRLLAALRDTFSVEGDATFEAHPATLDAETLALVSRYGFDRISLGVQSTQQSVLDAVGRTNPPLKVIEQRVHAATQQGAFVNLDLLIGLPGQTVTSVTNDLLWALGSRPRSVTLYRYQPVDLLRVDYPMVGLRDLPWRILIIRALMAGYLPVYDGTNDAFCASFYRVVPKHVPSRLPSTARLAAVSHLIRSGVFRRPLPARAQIQHFTGFDIGPIHVLGIGPGAISHLYGGAWYRDDTDAAEVSATQEPRLTARLLSPPEELRAAVARDLADGRWVRRREYLESVGLDPLALLDEAPRGLVVALRKSPHGVRLRPAHPLASSLLRWLLNRRDELAPTLARWCVDPAAAGVR